MAEIATTVPDIRRANKAQCAAFFGISLPTVETWIRQGMPVAQKGSRGVSWVIDLADVARWRFGSQATPGDDDPDALSAKERLDWYRGETEKRKLQKADSGLIEAAAHERALADLVKISIQWTETVPDVMEREAGLTPEQIERVQASVDRQRERLHRAWSDQKTEGARCS